MAERKVSRFESNMESFGAWIEKYVAPPLVKFGNQRHMAAIRTAYIRIIPIYNRGFGASDSHEPADSLTG